MNTCRHTATALLGLLVMTTVGCQRTYTAERELRPSGFLSSYDGLEPNKHGNYTYRDPAVKLADYDAFIIDAVVVKLHDPKSVPVNVQYKAKRYLQAAITNAVGEYHPIADRPGPGVARWRTAITEVRASGEGNGGLAAEIEIVDSVTGKRIVTAVANNDARGDHSDNPTRWHDARAVMDVWAGRVRAAFDEAHGVKPDRLPGN